VGDYKYSLFSAAIGGKPLQAPSTSQFSFTVKFRYFRVSLVLDEINRAHILTMWNADNALEQAVGLHNQAAKLVAAGCLADAARHLKRAAELVQAAVRMVRDSRQSSEYP
jgi:hypothetical protein